MPDPSGMRVSIPQDVQDAAKDFAKDLSRRLPPGWGFGIMLFTFGEDGALFWISNGQRSDMVKAMSEFIQAEGS